MDTDEDECSECGYGDTHGHAQGCSQDENNWDDPLADDSDDDGDGN